MNTLNTRKIILGLLTTLVLALGILDSTDALTFGKHTTSDGDLKRYFQNQEITIRVPITLKSPERLAGYKPVPSTDEADPPVSVPANERTNMFYDDDPDIAYVHGSTTIVDYAAAHYYDQENITIAVTGNANITRVGSHSVPSTGGNGFIMVERTHDDYDAAPDYRRLSGSITLTLEPTDAGTVVISITDTTAAADIRGGVASPPIVFTVYVVEYSSTPATALAFAGLTDNYHIGRNDEHDTSVQITVTPAANTPITYEVVDGSGRFYVQKTYTTPAGAPRSQGSSSRKLETSSNAAVATGGDAGADVYLDMGGTTNRVKISAPGHEDVYAIFVFGFPSIEITGGDGEKGATGGRLAAPLTVKVRDESRSRRGIPTAIVTFDTAEANARFFPVSGTTVFLSTANANKWATSYSDITDINDPISATSSYPEVNANADAVVVQTDRNGDAQVYFQLGETATAPQTITVNAVGAAQKTFRVTATDVDSTDAATITIIDGDNQRADVDDPLDDPLVVLVRDAGGRIVAGADVTFTTNSGELSAPESGDPGVYPPLDETGTARATTSHTTGFIVIDTDDTGRASVRYNVGDLPGAKQVFARIDVSNGRTKTKTFSINGRAAPPRDDPVDNNQDDTSTVTVRVPTSVDGTAGSTATLRVTAAATASVSAGVLNDTFPRENVGSFTRSGTIHSSILTLPDQVNNYSLTVFVGNVSYPVTVRVSQAAAQTRGRLDIQTDVSGGPGESKPVTISAINADGTGAADVTVQLRVTTGGGSFSPASVTTGDDGTATSRFTRGSTPGTNYFITATTTPAGYDTTESRGVRVTIAAGTGTQPPTGDTSAPSAAGEADAVDVYDGDGQRGILNSRLAELLVVEVTDANGNPVSGERVTFRTTIGSGRFSPARPRTNGGGRAQTWFTPTSSGTIRIAASVDGVSARAVFRVTTGDPPASLIKVSGDAQSGTPSRTLANPFVVEVKDTDGETIEGVNVTFSVTAGGGSLSETSATTDEDGRAETTLTLGSGHGINSVRASVSGVDPVTFNTSIEPEILLAAAQRPPMLWIDGGGIYALVGAKATQIASSADAVMDIAVSGNKLYWTEMTGENAGTINAANLDGTAIQQLVSIKAVPRGIAVDAVAKRLYWTNSHGWIQSSNLQGTRRQNVARDLSDPMGIAVGNGSVYWTQGDGSVQAMNLTGTKAVREVSTGTGPAGGVAIFGGKVYWTEMTGENAGTINAENLDGTGAKQLVSIRAVPRGIAVDPVAQRLYWTNSHGWIQSSNLEGRARRNVAKGLGSPGSIVVNANIKETPTMATPTTPTTPTTANRSKYDVNGDGSVDSTDTGLIVLAISTADTSAKYDVNGDGKVDFSDYLLVSENVDAGAAGAPSVFGMKMTAVQLERLQEQIDLLIASGDRSPAAMRALIYFQQLIATARPEKTQLLANYPNPFNPETWIPYELATDTDVRITIYTAQGVVIRTLQLGQQSAGYYTDRERAAYWDGRNAFGEQVASGVYFYQLETDTMSALRKMLILK